MNIHKKMPYVNDTKGTVLSKWLN